MTQPFLIDVDEVCVEWLPGFMKHMERLKVRRVEDTPVGYDLTDMYPALSEEDMMEEINVFGHTLAFRDLPLVDGVDKGLSIIRKQFPTSLIIAVSACGTDETIIKHRRHQLKYLPFDTIITLPLGSAKANIYRQFDDAVVVDDNLKHIKSALNLGHTALIYDRPWNQDIYELLEYPKERWSRMFNWEHVL